MTKPATKKERRMKKALEISLRNQPPGFKPRRKARRLQARLGMVEAPKFSREELQKKNVSELRTICAENGVAFTTRLRKDDLIDRILGEK